MTLRAPKRADAVRILLTCNDAATRAWTRVPQPYTQEIAHKFITEYAPGWWRSRRGGVFCLADERDRFLGFLEFELEATDPQVARLHYVISPDARGRGLATAAVRRLVRWGFEDLGVTRYDWAAFVGNRASRRVAENVGFVMKGIAPAWMEQRGSLLDCWRGELVGGRKVTSETG